MIVKRHKKDNKKKIGTFVAGAAGVVAVAGVAVAGAMVLRDGKNRAKVRKILTDAKDQAIDYVDTFKTEPAVKEAKRTIKGITADAKNVMGKNDFSKKG